MAGIPVDENEVRSDGIWNISTWNVQCLGNGDNVTWIKFLKTSESCKGAIFFFIKVIHNVMKV